MLASRNVVTIRVVLGFAMSTSKAQIITVHVISLVMQGMIAVQIHQKFASTRLENTCIECRWRLLISKSLYFWSCCTLKLYHGFVCGQSLTSIGQGYMLHACVLTFNHSACTTPQLHHAENLMLIQYMHAYSL